MGKYAPLAARENVSKFHLITLPFIKARLFKAPIQVWDTDQWRGDDFRWITTM